MSSSSTATPWLTLIGLGEDGLAGLCEAARAALDAADIVFGAPRHLALADVGARGEAWPVPFSIEPALAARGRRVVALVSGDPFWFGAGSVFAAQLQAGEWRAFPGVSSFSLAASHLGWRLEETACLGLHARPLAALVPHLAEGRRLLVLVRDGAAPQALARFLTERGFGASRLNVMERLAGPAERMRSTLAAAYELDDVASPVLVAIEARGARGLAATPGLPDDLFSHDGQITKQPVRALTLCALAPRRGETLWDVGAGSGSISVEWCLASNGRAVAIEPRADRIAVIRANREAFGLEEAMRIVEGAAPQALADLPAPDAIFIGGGATQDVLDAAWSALRPGARLVANAVTLETQALLCDRAARHGGGLTRLDIAQAAPLGRMRGWSPSRPLVQWSVTR